VAQLQFKPHTPNLPTPADTRTKKKETAKDSFSKPHAGRCYCNNTMLPPLLLLHQTDAAAAA
jgi:hypothetical protein